MSTQGRLPIPKGGLTERSLSVTIIRHCSAPAAVASDGVRRIDGSINAIAGARRAARRSQNLARTGSPYGAVYRI